MKNVNPSNRNNRLATIRSLLGQIESTSKNRDLEAREKELDELFASSEFGALTHELTPVLAGARQYLTVPDDRSEISNVQAKVISLPRSSRLFEFAKNWPFGFSFKVMEGVNARGEDFNYLNHRHYRDHLTDAPSPADLGHLGCTLSHYELWEQTELKQGELLLVLEDDAYFLPYSQLLLADISKNLPDDADLVYVNGRSAEKLYCSLDRKPPYKKLPRKLFYRRSQVNRIMNRHYDSLPKNGGKGVRHWTGTDGYILTASGLAKLKTFIQDAGVPPLTEGGAGTNIDTILAALSSQLSDQKKNGLGFVFGTSKSLGLLREPSYLNAYVTSIPLVDTRDKLGLGAPSEIAGAVNGDPKISRGDIDRIRDVAFGLPSENTPAAIELLELAHKLRPSGERIIQRLALLRAAREGRPEIQTAQINLQKKIIFVHIPKCGGTSIDNSGLFRHKAQGHRSLHLMKSMIGPEADSFRVFTVCRNPWDRLASAFYYLSEGGCGSSLDLELRDKFVAKFGGDFAAFLNGFIENSSYFLNCMHMWPAVRLIQPSKVVNPLFVQQLEAISQPEALFEFLGEKLEVGHERKRRTYSNVVHVYDEATFAAVGRIYADDVAEFGYSDYTLDDIKN
jgi:GR25 family glycosyltransferase involved in LPS biosynthesis